MKSDYIPPTKGAKAFNCPNCRIFAKQSWYHLRGAEREDGFGLQREDNRFLISYCESCGFPTIWDKNGIIYPAYSIAENPNPDLPDEIKSDYNEARDIVDKSPRGASALLRLCIQKLCSYLGQSGNNINDDIKELVKNGLPPKVQEALDSVRVIGNEAVHPGTLNIKDDREIALKLFKLVNFIAQKTITEPKEIDEIYSSLPKDKIDGIKKRDGK